MMPEWAADLLRLATFLAILWLMWYSRRWTLPAQDAELRALEDDVRGIRANQHRIERDVYEFRKEFLSVNDSVLKELQALNQNGAREAPLEHQLREVQDAIFELERTITAMPCAMHVANNLGALPKPEPKE